MHCRLPVEDAWYPRGHRVHVWLLLLEAPLADEEYVPAEQLVHDGLAPEGSVE